MTHMDECMRCHHRYVVYNDPRLNHAHRCKPEWEAVSEVDLRFLCAEWSLVYAEDTETAAEQWAEQYDRNSDYSIVSGRRPHVVYVRSVADEDFIGPTWAECYSVEGEAVPTYSAYKVQHPKGV